MAEFDRPAEDIGNIVLLEHVNVTQPDQRLATLFYVSGLGLTRDPYLMVGTDNMWINIGRNQMHLPTGEPKRVRGTIGLVLPDPGALKARLAKVAPQLSGTQFSWRENGTTVEASCPWGNRFRCHAPAPEFGATELALAYVEFDVPAGIAPGIVRFYSQIMAAPASLGERNGAPAADVRVGRGQRMLFVEASARVADWDGHHVQIYIADFSGPYRRLLERGLVSMEANEHEWRFTDIVDPADGRLLYRLEHEVRSMKHPLYARALVNRNPAQSNIGYVAGHDAFRGTF
jgi:hypothetical protein